MKKLFVLLVFMAIFSTGYSQVTGREVKTYYIPTETTKLPYNIEPGNLIYVGSTGNTYLASGLAKAGRTPATLKAAATVTLAAVANSSYYVDTATAQNVRGVKTFYSAPTFTFGSGLYNVGLGTQALLANTTGASCVAIGGLSLKSNTSGARNIGIGFQAGNQVTTGGDLIFIGYDAGRYVTTSSNSVGLGRNSMMSAGGGSTEVTAVGHQSVMGGGERTVGVGGQAGGSSKNYWNTFIGNNAGYTNATDIEGSIRIGNRAGGYAIDTSDYSLYIHSSDQTVSTSPDSNNAIIYGKMTPDGSVNFLRLNAYTSIRNTLTVSTLPSFTIAAGQTTPTGKDTSQVTVAGLTTSAIILCSYGENITTADTLPTVYRLITGKVTFRGKVNKKINYWIPKK